LISPSQGDPAAKLLTELWRRDLLVVAFWGANMKREYFLIFAAIAYAIFGLGLLLVPAEFMAPFGVTLDVAGVLMSRILGSALVFLAALFWLVRTDAGPAARTIFGTQALYNAVDILVLVMAISAGTMGVLGWMPVGLHAVLAIGFALSWRR
jgi:hypothetical protein